MCFHQVQCDDCVVLFGCTYNEHEGNHHKCLPVVSIKCGKTLPGVLANNGEGLRRSTWCQRCTLYILTYSNDVVRISCILYMYMNSGSSVSIFRTVPLVHPVHDTRSIVIPWDCRLCLAIRDVRICRVTMTLSILIYSYVCRTQLPTWKR